MNKLIYTILVFIKLLSFFPCNINAQGDLLLFPKRIVFEQGKRTEIINMANSGTDTVKYSISFVQIRMNEYGSFENITIADSNQFFADPYIRFYPRTVTLAPGESQVVKLQVTRTNSLDVGEYRSHLYFRADPLNNQIENETIIDDTSSISFKLIPVYGITIPIIIRIGEPTANVEITDFAFQRDKDMNPNIRIHINRIGNKSVYGDIVVTYESPEGKKTQVGEVSGVAVYSPGTIRKSVIKLMEPKGVDYSKGKLIVTFSSPNKDDKFQPVEATLELSKLVVSK